MTAIPCFMGTCSIDLDTDPVTGQLIANARTADTGSLDCVDRADPDETDGLFVQVSGLTQDATSGVNAPCGQSLGRAVNGDLFAYPEGAYVLEDLVGRSVTTGLPTDNGGTEPDDPHLDDVIECHDVFVANPWDCPAWAIFSYAEMKVTGRRHEDVTAETFWATMFGRITVNGGIIGTPATNAALNRKDIHGVWDGAGNAPEHSHAWNMFAVFHLSASGIARVRSTINVTSRRRFTLDGGNAGIFFLHPWAAIWREDLHAVENAQPAPPAIPPNDCDPLIPA